MSYFETAKAVIREANERDVTTDEVLADLYPFGRGGVGRAHQKAKQEIAKRIREWLEPGEPSEPNGMRS